jgi:endonuclease YncB( thermonuclease family)
MTFAKVVESRRHRQRPHKLRPPRRRLRAPWQPLAILAAVAGSLWFATAPYPNLMSANGALAINGSGVFALCALASERNCVIDGDTIRYGGTKIRLEGIDAPEVFSPRCPSEAARGRRATRRLLELINAGPFELVRTGDREHDRYGRTLRTIARGGRSLGDVLIAEGLARRWDGARHSWCG